jgi:hypothetical protein
MSGTFPAAGLADGDYDLTASAEDAAGNASDQTTATLTVDTAGDTTPPNAPVINTTTTTDPTPVITGTAEADSTLVLTITIEENVFTYTTTVDGDGTWSVQINQVLAPAEYPLEATAEDAAGNVSDPATATLTVETVDDTTPPDAPTFDAASLTTTDTTPTISGGTEANSTLVLTITIGGSPVVYSDTTTADGTWSVTIDQELTPGAYDLEATAEDAAGNVSEPGTATLNVIEEGDTTPPDAPVILTTTTSDPTPVIEGTAEAGSTVVLTISASLPGFPLVYENISVNASGEWILDTETVSPDSGIFPASGLGLGDYTLTATATDASGNTSEPGTATLTVTEADTTPPVAPTIVTTTTVDLTPIITGTTEAESVVELTIQIDNTDFVYTDTTTPDGIWSVQVTEMLTVGVTYPLAATATDAAGNTSEPATATLTVEAEDDTTPPDAPVIGTTTTDDTTPVITGTAEATSTVVLTITIGGTDFAYTTTTTADGTWSVQVDQELTPGETYPLAATATDAAGNTSAEATATLTVSETDITAPEPPDVGGVTVIRSSDPSPVFSGTAEPGSTITLTITDVAGGPLVYEITVDENGNWTIDTETATPISGTFPDGGLPDGTYTVTITATDAAGNTSDPTTLTLIIDTNLYLPLISK